MHVLIVEGDGEAAGAIARKLRKLGQTSVIADDIAQAAAEAAPLRTPPTTPIDIAIVNADLPGDGAAKLMPLLAEVGIRGIAIAEGKADWLAMKAAGFTFSLAAPVTFADLKALFAPLDEPPEKPKRRHPHRRAKR